MQLRIVCSPICVNSTRAAAGISKVRRHARTGSRGAWAGDWSLRGITFASPASSASSCVFQMMRSGAASCRTPRSVRCSARQRRPTSPCCWTWRDSAPRRNSTKRCRSMHACSVTVRRQTRVTNSGGMFSVATPNLAWSRFRQHRIRKKPAGAARRRCNTSYQRAERMFRLRFNGGLSATALSVSTLAPKLTEPGSKHDSAEAGAPITWPLVATATLLLNESD